MPTTGHPGMRDMSGGNRPWSIGSQLLGHYGLYSRNPSINQASDTNVRYSHTHTVVHIHNDTTHPTLRSTFSGSSRATSFIAATTDTDTESQDLQQLLRASTTFYERILTDWWYWELFSWFVSFSCATAIVVVLFVFSGKKQPQYIISGITMNAYIAVFAAISKAALILPVSEAIGQLKWIWFRNESNLWEFALFDGASRGPWGSLALLKRTKCSHVVSLGAVITVLALAFEPFLQQVVVYPERAIPVGSALTKAATSYVLDSAPNTRAARIGGQIRSKFDASMQSTIDAAILMQNQVSKPVPVVCPTGNCTFPDYSTLGVCHQCTDVSQHLEYMCQNNTILGNGSMSIRNPCGFQFDGVFVAGTSHYGRNQVTSLSTILVNTTGTSVIFRPFLASTVYGNATFPIVDFYVGYVPGGLPAAQRNDTPVLLECLISWCIKTLSTTVIEGITRQQTIQTLTVQPDTEWQDDVDHPVLAVTTRDNKTFEILNGTTSFIQQAIQGDLPPYLYQDAKYDFTEYSGIWDFHQKPPYDFNSVLSNLTDAITNDLRTRSNNVNEVVGIQY